MTKRFSDSELWNKDWYLNLSLKQKLLVKYIFDNCDCAGIYEISYRVLKNIFGDEITKEDFLAIKQVKFVSENKIFIEDFIKFQYGVEISQLNDNYSVHKGIIKKLNKINYFETLTQPLPNSLEELQDKVKDKDKENTFSSSLVLSSSFKHRQIKPKNPDLMFNQEINKVFEIYKKECKCLIPVGFEFRDLAFRQEILGFLDLIRGDFAYFVELCRKANELKFIVKKKIDLKAILANYSRIYSGFYKEKAEEGESREDFIKRKMTENEQYH